MSEYITDHRLMVVYTIFVGLVLLVVAGAFAYVLSSWFDWSRSHTDHRRRESARWREPWL